MVTLYVQRNPDERIDTQYGNLTYLDWLKNEKERIEKDPTRTAEISTEGWFTVGLRVNEVPGCKCEACVRMYG